MFLPYLTGERTPHADPNAKGAFVGLTVRHGLAHMARAVMEGVAFGLRDAFELVVAAEPDVDEVRITGGGARSPLWRQIISDVLAVAAHNRWSRGRSGVWRRHPGRHRDRVVAQCARAGCRVGRRGIGRGPWRLVGCVRLLPALPRSLSGPGSNVPCAVGPSVAP